MSLGKNIKHYRIKSGLTQKQLGEIVGKSTVSIRKYESGLVEPPMTVLQDIAKALNISTIELMVSKEELDNIGDIQVGYINIKPPTKHVLDMNKINTIDDIKAILSLLDIGVYDNFKNFKELKPYLREE